MSAIVFVLLIFAFLLREGVPAFFEVKLPVLFGTRWYPTEGYFGLWPLVLGSVLVTLGAAALALPTGLLAAVFVAEVSPRWLREIVKPMIEVVAGIPSVVLGFLGMLALSPLVRQVFNAPTGLTAFTGSLVLAYMALPTIISVAEDALDAVPKSYRDAALALGATQMANHLARDGSGGAHRHPHGDDAGHRARDRRDDGGDDGHGQCRAPAADAGQLDALGADDDGHHRRRDGRGGARQRAFSCLVCDWHHLVSHHVCW